MILYTESGHLGMQIDLRKLSAAVQHSLCVAEGKEILGKMQVFQRTLNHMSHFRWVRAEQIHDFAGALSSFVVSAG